MIAGTSIIDITPEKGIALCGYPRFDRKNIGVHDTLYVSSLYLDNGNDRLLIICCDLVYLETVFVKNLKKIIASNTNISENNIMISSSHTHSGPFTDSKKPGFEKSVGTYTYNYPEYLEKLKKQLLKISVDSYKETFRASICYGKGKAGKEIGIGGNRNNPNGIADPTIGIIGIKDQLGIYRAIWIKYSLHPTIMHADNLLVSADFGGYLREYLKNVFPKANILFAQGASGNQSSRYFRQDQTFEEARRFGYGIGKQAAEVLNIIGSKKCNIIESGSVFIEPDLKDFPSEEKTEAKIKKLEKKLTKLKEDKASYTEIQTYSLNILGAKCELFYIRNKEIADSAKLPIEIQIFRIGDICIVGIACEIYVEFALEIEKRSPFKNTFIATLTNGIHKGYIITEEAARKDTYESGNTLSKPGTGKNIVQKSIEILKELYGRI